MQSWLKQARILSGLTVEDCCQALFQSANEYLSKEQNPGTLTLNEIRVLMQLFCRDAQQLVWNALSDLNPQ